MSNPRVGIIANPASGKDIRRLIAYATTVDNQGKVNIVRRALVGLAASGIREVLYMPDTHGICTRAREGLSNLRQDLPAFEPVDMGVTGRTEDSTQAAILLRSMGVGCIIVLGGDGTVRAVSKGCGDVPVLAISTGTNNVLPGFVEGTIAGLAAGYVAQAILPLSEAAIRHKWLELAINAVAVDRALVDIAALHGQFLGARAVWETGDLCQVIVTRADPASIGISAIAAMVRAISPEETVGLAVDIDANSERCVTAAYGPGLIGRVGITSAHLINVGESVSLPTERPLMVALDGEREHVLSHNDVGTITLHADGPWLVDTSRVMRTIALRQASCLPGLF